MVITTYFLYIILPKCKVLVAIIKCLISLNNESLVGDDSRLNYILWKLVACES